MGILSFRSLTGRPEKPAPGAPGPRGNRLGVDTPFGALGHSPADWEGLLILRDGSPVFIRPLRADDAALFGAFLENVSMEDRRMRFFAPLREPSETLIRMLVDVDHTHDAAFAAFDPGSGIMLGGVRLHAADDMSSGEFAVSVRSDLKGHGLGWALMQLIITYARMRDIAEIHGSVLRENSTMLAMCRHLGFAVTDDAVDPLLTHVSFEVEAVMGSLFDPRPAEPQ